MENWQDNLGEDIKDNPTLQQYKTADDAFKGLIESRALRGRSVVTPNDDSNPEEMQKYFERLVETADGKLMIHPDHANDEAYTAQYKKMLGIPVDVGGYGDVEVEAMDAAVVDQVKAMAFDIGMSKKDTVALIAKLDAQQGEQSAAFEQLKTDDTALITTRFGNAEKQKKDAINQLIADNADPEHPLGELNAAAYILLDNIVAKFQGKGPQVFNQPTGDVRQTPGELKAKQAEIIDKMADGRGMGQAKYNKLQSQLNAVNEQMYG
jgi:hypothetical protein